MAIHTSRRRPAPTIAALVWLLCGGACDSGSSTPEGSLLAQSPAVAQIAGKLDPAPFREQIEALERALYLNRPGVEEDYRKVGAAVLDLVNQIGNVDSSSIGREAAGKLLFFSAHAETAFGDPYIDGLGPIQKDWLKLRNEYFAPAVWLRSAPDSVQARVPSGASPTDLARVEQVVTALEGLMQRARLEVIALGEPKYKPGQVSPEGDAQIARWRDWGITWQRSVQDATAVLPAYPGTSGPADLLSALESVDLAVLHLELLTQGHGDYATPLRSEWEMRFDSAERALRIAREFLPASS